MPDTSREDAVRTTAERLFARQLSSPGNDHERMALLRWLNESPEHQRAYDATQATWAALGELHEDADLAALALKAEATARDWRRESRQTARRRKPLWLAPALAASMLLALSAVLFTVMMRDDFAAGGTLLATEMSERRSEVLADGSTVTLNAETRVEAKVDGQVRQIRVDDGEAVFGVSHDPARPFVVRVGRDITVTALGTRFHVRHRTGEARVTLLEGSVRVERGGQSRILGVGEQAVFGDQEWRVQQVDLADATSWARGWMVFRGQPLRHVVEEVNRYAQHKIRIADAELGERPLSGNFYLGDSASMTAAMAVLLALDVQRDGDDFILHRPRP